jgi:hypothetical protein
MLQVLITTNYGNIGYVYCMYFFKLGDTKLGIVLPTSEGNFDIF